jgi:hypothetical protein
MEGAIIPIWRQLPNIVHDTLVRPRRSDLEFKHWRECQSPYASLLSGRLSALYVVSQNDYVNYASVISFRSLAIIHLLYHRSRTYKTRTVFGYTFIAHVLMHHCKSCMCINQASAFTTIAYHYWLTRIAIHWILAGLHDSTSIITRKPSQFSITSVRRIIKST